jgi:hypothetical protein
VAEHGGTVSSVAKLSFMMIVASPPSAFTWSNSQHENIR